MTATATGRPRCTVRRLSWSEPDNGGRTLKGAIAGDSLNQVRAHLGQEQLDRAHARGTPLNSDEALDLASGTLPA
jgi:hypothetical protein